MVISLKTRRHRSGCKRTQKLGTAEMGIKGLNTWITSNFQGVMQPLLDRASAKSGGSALTSGSNAHTIGGARLYDHVLFDLNGIVHQACRKCPSERKVMEEIVSELDSLLRLFPATASVLIALDGVGPAAKLMEQRKRRISKVLKDARDAEAMVPGSAENLRRQELRRRQEEKGRPPPPTKKKKKKSTDSLQVTPGTMFMLRLKRVLDWYALTRACGVGDVFTSQRPVILISAADVSGEGELKLLQHVHTVLRAPLSPAAPPPSFLLVGPDADLLLLALASGSPRCDVLTTDTRGCPKLFIVKTLGDALLQQLGAPSAPAPVAFGGLHQLDFLVICFLMGNDYVPKLRGAKLPVLWSALLRLLRGSEFRGEHLLLLSEGMVEVNTRLLIALTSAACVGVAVAGALHAEDDDDSNDDDADDCEWGGEGDSDGASGAAASPSPHPSPPHASTAALGPSRKADAESYLSTLAWCAYMYFSGCCPDYSVSYTARAAPTATQLAAYVAKSERDSGRPCRPSYQAPPHAGAAGSAPLPPDIFCMCLLPAAAAAYLPRPLQAFMLDPRHPLADIFHANHVWPRDIVRRITEAVASVPRAAYTAEELASISSGAVRVVIPAAQGQPVAPLPPWLRDCRHSPLRAAPPSPLGSGRELRDIGKVAVAQIQPDVCGSSLARWAWSSGIPLLHLPACHHPPAQAADVSALPAASDLSRLVSALSLSHSPMHAAVAVAAQPLSLCVKEMVRGGKRTGATSSTGCGSEFVAVAGGRLRALHPPLHPSLAHNGAAADGAATASVQHPAEQAPMQSLAQAVYAFLLNFPEPATSPAAAVRLSALGSALVDRIRSEKVKLQKCLLAHPSMFCLLDVDKPGYASVYIITP
jgi:hypothetical protein